MRTDLFALPALAVGSITVGFVTGSRALIVVGVVGLVALLAFKIAAVLANRRARRDSTSAQARGPNQE